MQGVRNVGPLLADPHHGFSSGRSCLTNLLSFLDRVSGLVDNGECVDVIFLDFAKAFDKVPHLRLIKKLASHGIDGKLLEWISQWLTGRMQRVSLGGRVGVGLEVGVDWSTAGLGVGTGAVPDIHKRSRGWNQELDTKVCR